MFLPEAHYKIYSKIEPKTIKWAQHLRPDYIYKLRCFGQYGVDGLKG